MTPDVRWAFDSAEPFDLHGVVLRVDLLKLVMHGIGFFEVDSNGDIPPSRSHIPPTQRVRPAKQARLHCRGSPLTNRCGVDMCFPLLCLLGTPLK